MLEVGIIGGAGYTAGELIRLLLNHPNIKLVFVNSTSNAGNKLSDIHTDLIGDTELKFTNKSPYADIDLLYFCTPHGKTREFLSNNTIPIDLKLIDLSTDYRHKNTAEGFVYGLPELNSEAISQANRVANPGCFATAIQLALLPLANANLINSEVHVHAITGSTGAGIMPGAATHFSWRDNNISIYNPFQHRHLKEIEESVEQLQKGFDKTINFIPVRGDFPRGIFASTYLDYDGDIESAYKLFVDYYQNSPFTIISRKPIDMKQAVNTNKAILYLEYFEGKLLIVSCIDNLIKGASGQAIQNMNLMFGLDETTGLKLKASAF